MGNQRLKESAFALEEANWPVNAVILSSLRSTFWFSMGAGLCVVFASIFLFLLGKLLACSCETTCAPCESSWTPQRLNLISKYITGHERRSYHLSREVDRLVFQRIVVCNHYERKVKVVYLYTNKVDLLSRCICTCRAIWYAILVSLVFNPLSELPWARTMSWSRIGCILNLGRGCEPSMQRQ